VTVLVSFGFGDGFDPVEEDSSFSLNWDCCCPDFEIALGFATF
jgi:hypothetical protein